MHKGDFLSENIPAIEVEESFFEIEESFSNYESECRIVGEAFEESFSNYEESSFEIEESFSNFEESECITVGEETGVGWVHYKIHYFLGKLNDLYTDWSAASPLKGQLRTLHQELRFAKTYVRYLRLCEHQNISFDSDESEFVVESIYRALSETNLDMERFPAYDYDYFEQVSSGVSNLLDKINDLKPKIRKTWSSNLFNQSPEFSGGCFYELLCDVKASLKDVVDSRSLSIAMKKHMQVLNNYLHFLEGVEKSIDVGYYGHPMRPTALRYVGFTAVSIAFLSYYLWDDNVAEGMDIKPSDILQKIKIGSPELLEMFVRVLRDSNSKGYREAEYANNFQVVRLVNFILQDSVDSIHEQTADIRGQLIFLLRFSMNLPDDCAGDLKRISADIAAVAWEAANFECKFCATDGKEDQNKQMTGSCGVAWFLEKIRLIKAEIFLIQLLDSKDTLMVLMKDEIAALHEGLKFLGAISVDPPKERTEDIKPFLTRLQKVSSAISSLVQVIHDQNITKEMVKRINLDLFWLLENIKLIKAEANVMKLQKSEEAYLVHQKDKIDALLDGMRSWIAFFMDTTDTEESTEDGKLYLAYLQAVIGKSSPLSFSFHFSNLPEDIVSEFFAICETVAKKEASLNSFHFRGTVENDRMMSMNILFSGLLQNFGLFKVKIRKIYLQLVKSLQSNLPKTDAPGFVSSLLQNLNALMNDKPHFVASSLKHHIELVYTELEFLKSFFLDKAKQHNDHQELNDTWTSIIDIAYEAEYLIDSLVVRDGSLLYHMLWLSIIAEDLNLVKKKAMEIYDKNEVDVEVHNTADTSGYVPSLPGVSQIDEVIVGFNDEAAKIIDRLTRGTMQMDIVSVFGMPGLGKTTLARKVYNDPSVTYYFHVRAWSCVSQVYQRRELLLDSLSDVIELTDEIHRMSDDDIAEVLYKSLKGKRYLIVLDDLWNIEAWEDLRSSFPNDNNGSRVLFTSRLRDVALKAKPDSNPHPLRVLSDEESWELLQKKLSIKEGFPITLLEVGKEIAKNCKGLPLSIVVIAGVLASTKGKPDLWRQVSENLCSRIVADPQGGCMHILELSYKHLPDHLKSCFLYFGAFPEDKEIPVWKLQWLWMAEGFLHLTDQKSLENAAEGYLLDLIDRSLVKVAKRRSTGGVKSCRIHDLLRDLCVQKAKEENLLQIVQGYDELFMASPDCLDYGFDSDFYTSTSVSYQQQRLCICSKRQHFAMLKPCGSRIHSLLFLASNDTRPRWPYDVSFISHNFKILRVLDLDSINMGKCFPTGIELLVHLRYLAVRGDINSVPSSIANLWNLETFLVKGLRGEVALPDSFWNMKKLRHVHINDRAFLSFEDGKHKIHFLLENIYTFSTPALSYGEDTEKMMRRLPRLRKLKCIFLESSNYFGKGNKFPVLDFLTHLESLKILYHGKVRHPCEFNFPSNLKKLTMSKFCLPWNDISTIGRLPNLEVLKLKSRSFDGQTWGMREGEFLKLKFLRLDSLNIVQWSASSDHLPCLEHLVLQSCKQLQEVPSGFGDIPTLQTIEVYWCNDSAAVSVKQILEEQRCMGNELLNVLIAAGK